jgi:hypothetical protein
VLYLEADKSFIVGHVSFLYISAAYIKELANKIEENKRADYIEHLAKYKGQLMAKCAVRAEKQRAIRYLSHKLFFP